MRLGFRRDFGRFLPSAAGLILLAGPATAQETDVTQTPNAANAGIKKSLEEEIGAGRGDIMTPGSSLFIIGRDPFRSIARGRQLFQRKFTVAQGSGPRTNDGVGDIETDASHGAGLADSCAACHGRPQGSAGFGGDVFTRPSSRDAPHLFGLGLQEMLADEITQELRAIQAEAVDEAETLGHTVRLPLVSKGIHYGWIIGRPNGSVNTSFVEGVNTDLRVRPFFAEGTTISIREFVVGALNAEMGLEAPDPDLLEANGGDDVETPSGMLLSGSIDDIEGPPVLHELDDPDMDGVVNEIPVSLVDHLEFYLLNYFKPGIHEVSKHAKKGRKILEATGCANCHVPDLLIVHDRRVADVDTNFDKRQGNPYNRLFADAIPKFHEIDDGSGFPTIKAPLAEPFLVKNIFTDFKRHDLGPAFWERNFDGSVQKEFLTEPLWGVGTTGPYGHDGRSLTLEDVILRHGGEAEEARDNFKHLKKKDKHSILEFFNALVIFPPPATASALNPADKKAQDFPLNGHGSIDLSVLFNNPSDKE